MVNFSIKLEKVKKKKRAIELIPMHKFDLHLKKKRIEFQF